MRAWVIHNVYFADYCRLLPKCIEFGCADSMIGIGLSFSVRLPAKWLSFTSGIAMGLACLGTATLANAQTVGLSGGWFVTPYTFIPIENGNTLYSVQPRGVVDLQTGMATTVQMALSNETNTLVSPGLVTGYALVDAVALAAQGGNTGFALSLGLGDAVAAEIGAATVTQITANGANASNSQVNNAAIVTAQSNVTSTAQSGLTGNGVRLNDLQLSANANTTGNASPNPTVITFQPNINAVPNNFELTTNMSPGGIVAAAQSQPAASLQGDFANNVNAQLNAPSNAFSFTSGFTDTPAISSLITTNNGSANFEANFSGADQSIRTLAARAAGISTIVSSIDESNVTIRSTGDNFNAATVGDNSYALLIGVNGGSNSNVSLETAGANSNIVTTGNLAHGIFSVASASQGRADQDIRLSGASNSVRTNGNGSNGTILVTTASQSAINSVHLSGISSSIRTNGADASAVNLFAQGARTSQNVLSLSGANTALQTGGPNSTALLSFSQAQETARNEVNLSGQNTSISTNGNGSLGYLGLVSADLTATNAIGLNGFGANITTRGNDATATWSAASAVNATQIVSLGGNNANVRTTGLRSPGALLFGLGGENGAVTLQLAGNGAQIKTRGDFSPAAALGATGTQSANVELSLSGRMAALITSGDFSPAGFFAGMNANIALTGPGANITTAGLHSHGVHSLASTIEVAITRTAGIFANGPQSDAIHSPSVGSVINLQNSGTVEGSRRGVFNAGMASIQNNGRIAGGSAEAIRIDSGDIQNRGTVIGNSGITATQNTGGAVSVTNLGALFSTLGFAGSALDFQGNAADTLTVGPEAAISGTIELGGGNDTVRFLPGTNADLVFQSPVETSTTDTGALVRLDGGRRIVVANPDIYLDHSRITAVSAANSVDDFWKSNLAENGDPANSQCSTQTSVAGHAGVYKQGQTSSRRQARHEQIGAVGRAQFTDCSNINLGIFAGFFNSDVTQSTIADGESDTIIAGADLSASNGDQTVFLLGGGGLTETEASRRVIDNREDNGFRNARADYDTAFVFAQLGLAQKVVSEFVDFHPYVTTKAVVGRRDSLTESSVPGPLRLSGDTFIETEVLAGVHFKTDNQITGIDGVALFGDLAASFTEAFDDQESDGTLAGAASKFKSPKDSGGFGFRAEGGVKVSSSISPASLQWLVAYNQKSDSNSNYSTSLEMTIPF